jgi:hypothetical protein
MTFLIKLHDLIPGCEAVHLGDLNTIPNTAQNRKDGYIITMRRLLTTLSHAENLPPALLVFSQAGTCMYRVTCIKVSIKGNN